MYKKLSMVGYAAANNLAKFICDTESDLTSLPTLTAPSADGSSEPCGVGSVAVVLNNQTCYMLSNAGTWVEYGSTAGGGVSEDFIATLAEVQTYVG